VFKTVINSEASLPVFKVCLNFGGLMKKTSFFLILFIGAALLVTLAVLPDGSRAADDSKITVVYSSNMLGYTEPCG